MNISLEDFNALSAEQSRREVRIATLEMELQAQAARYEEMTADLLREREALCDELAKLRAQNELLRTDYENIRFENHWMKQYILLSVEKVQHFFSHIRDFTLLSAIKSFVLDMLPPNATPEMMTSASTGLKLGSMMNTMRPATLTAQSTAMMTSSRGWGLRPSKIRKKGVMHSSITSRMMK